MRISASLFGTTTCIESRIGARRPSEALLAPLAGHLCRILHLDFRA
jgi:hypothetical protein